MSAKHHTRNGLFGVLLAVEGLILAATACATSEEPVAPEGDEAAAPDARVAADTSAPDAPDGSTKDAAVRTCSDQDFCHTALPPNETLRDVWGDGTNVWSVSEEGDVLRWDGTAWKVHASALGALYAVWGSGPTNVWIGGERGLFHGTGASSAALVFAPEAAPGNAQAPIRSIWGTGATNVWAVGGYVDADFLPRGRVLRYRAAGDAGPSSWVVDPLSSRPLSFTRVWGTTASGTWIGGDDGSDFAQTGGVFRRTPTANAFVVVAVRAFDAAAKKDSALVGFTAGGASADGAMLLAGKNGEATPGFWRGVTPDGGAEAGSYAWSYGARDLNDLPVHAVWGPSVDDTWAAGDYGRLRRWDGALWKQAALMIADLPVITPLFAMWGASSDDFWVVGRDIALHRKKRP